MHLNRDSNLAARKDDHIRINLEEDVQSGIVTGLSKLRFIHNALPEVNLEDVHMQQSLFGKSVRIPILISSMTGGSESSFEINQRLAQAAQQTGAALGLGSIRAGLEHPELAYTFQIRKFAPDILLLANLGAVQLEYGYTVETCQRAVDLMEADALILHLNPLQEALQPEGQTRFNGLLAKIEQVCRHLNVPVIAKEVGWGISKATAKQLYSAGVAAIDVAGAGGTSWSQVEMFRSHTDDQAEIASEFRGWGISTLEAILNVKAAAPDLKLIASGGLRGGMDCAKCLALGAALAGLARPFLHSAAQSTEQVIRKIQLIGRVIQISMFATGCRNLDEFHTQPVLYYEERAIR